VMWYASLILNSMQEVINQYEGFDSVEEKKSRNPLCFHAVTAAPSCGVSLYLYYT